MSCPLHAWGDESIRTRGLPAPAYLLGASVLDLQDADAVRMQLLALHTGGSKLHWYELDAAHRRHVADVVRTAAAGHLIVVARPIDMRRQERARAACLRRLAWELSEIGASRLTLEARPDALMVRDRRTVDDLRVRGVIPPSMRIEHGRPSEDALLWLPDQALGLVGESIVRGDDHRMMLGNWTRVVEIEP
jgi:hypothetical protein